MKLVVNQKPSDFQDGLTIAQLLVELKLDGKPVAVEVNEELVPGECHSRHKLSDGDQLEIVTLAGGG